MWLRMCVVYCSGLSDMIIVVYNMDSVAGMGVITCVDVVDMQCY